MNRPLVPIVAAASFALTACGGGPPTAPAQPKAEADDAGYGAPPSVTAVQTTGGGVLLTGVGTPKATVRLATPGGVAQAVPVDPEGHWRLTTPAHAAAAIYGLSQSLSGRTVQSEGYLLITPDGRGVQLRAGIGALTIGDQPAIGITSFDVDRDGAAVVSGRGPADGSVSAHVDGRKLGEGRIAQDGRFSIPLSGPAVSPGHHNLKVFGDSLDETLSIDAGPAAPLTAGPFRATPTPAGLRVDWMTPGGGVQTTLVPSSRLASGEIAHRVIP